MRHTLWLQAILCLSCSGTTLDTGTATEASPKVDHRETAAKPGAAIRAASRHSDEARRIAVEQTPTLPQAPPIPQHPTPLEMPEWRPASHVGPDKGVPFPAPVAIVLHGNYDRPEWECDLWKEVAGFHGWILCPRGIRSSPLSEDRWKYANRPATRREIEASLKALEARYPGRVTRSKMILVGFSLGAIMAPDIVQEDPGRYDHAFFVEGGMQKLIKIKPSQLTKAGLKGVGFAMSGPWRRKVAKRFAESWPKAGLKVVFVDMEGAGHGYRRDFPVTGRAGLRQLLEGK